MKTLFIALLLSSPLMAQIVRPSVFTSSFGVTVNTQNNSDKNIHCIGQIMIRKKSGLLHYEYHNEYLRAQQFSSKYYPNFSTQDPYLFSNNFINCYSI